MHMHVHSHVRMHILQVHMHVRTVQTLKRTHNTHMRVHVPIAFCVYALADAKYARASQNARAYACVLTRYNPVEASVETF